MFGLLSILCLSLSLSSNEQWVSWAKEHFSLYNWQRVYKVLITQLWSGNDHSPYIFYFWLVFRLSSILSTSTNCSAATLIKLPSLQQILDLYWKTLFALGNSSDRPRRWTMKRWNIIQGERVCCFSVIGWQIVTHSLTESLQAAKSARGSEVMSKCTSLASQA